MSLILLSAHFVLLILLMSLLGFLCDFMSLYWYFSLQKVASTISPEIMDPRLKTIVPRFLGVEKGQRESCW